MKYINEVTINLPIDKVITLFDNTENMYAWMDGLKSHELISGNAGQVGAKTKLHFDSGDGAFEMVETITEKNLPQSYGGRYESRFATNTVRIKFQSVSSEKTLMRSETKVEPHTFMVRLMCWLLPANFKKQSQIYLENFKAFTEKN